MMDRTLFLPVSKQDLLDRGIQQLDFICVTGDAYVDLPSFGSTIIGRVLEDEGFTVGMIAQPNWRDIKDITRLGRPKFGFFVGSGNVDSMVNHYTSAKKPRSSDYYSPGGAAGKRPDRAVTVYCRLIRQAFGDIPIIMGGIEASLRRFAHYDYWSDSVMPSILLDSAADLLSYGMSEKQTASIAKALAAGEPVSRLTNIPGTAYVVEASQIPYGILNCPSFEAVQVNKREYAKACRIQYDNCDHIYGRTLLQRHGKQAVIQNPPMPPLTTEELDHVYQLPYARSYHPDYEAGGGVPSIQEVEFSITHNRGCFGHCNFCAIAYHQGRYISKRSVESVVQEAEQMVRSPRFKGYIHDVGGPTANFRNPSCQKQQKHGMCPGKKCLAPEPCPSLEVSHKEYLEILRKLRSIKGVKKVFIRSGLRYDYLLLDKDEQFLDELIRHHISGQLKVAPEHCSNNVLDAMGKPHIEVYERFQQKYYQKNKRIGKEQYLIPYLMSSHPGSTLEDAVELALFLKKNKIRPEQVQDFYPTPGSISTCMFYTGLDPYTLKPVFVPRSAAEKKMQRALLQYYRLENRDTIEKSLKIVGRTDLIGTEKNHLIPPGPKNPVPNRNTKRKGGKRPWQKGEGGQRGNRR